MHALNQVCSVGLDKISLQTRNLSYFCKFCIDSGDGPCDHANYVLRFDLIWLVPCRPQDVRNDGIDKDNYLISSNREMLVTTLDVGDHFLVIVVEDNNEGDDFWVFISEEALAMVEEVDYWGQKVYKG